MPIVLSRSPETNTRSDYFVSRLAGPRVAGRRVGKGERLSLSEYEARAELLSGALVRDEARVEDPFGEVAAAAGATGASGAGPTGASGPTGTTGAGSTGATGVKGTTGLTGSAASAGSTGAAAPAGATGATGRG